MEEELELFIEEAIEETGSTVSSASDKALDMPVGDPELNNAIVSPSTEDERRVGARSQVVSHMRREFYSAVYDDEDTLRSCIQSGHRLKVTLTRADCRWTDLFWLVQRTVLH